MAALRIVAGLGSIRLGQSLTPKSRLRPRASRTELGNMSRFALFVCLSAVGCGGVAAASAEPKPGEESERPPSGFYRAEVETATDCSPAPPARETRELLVFTAGSGLDTAIWFDTRVDVPWSGQLQETIPGCYSSVRVETVAATSASFSVQSDWVWLDPGRCPAAVMAPSFECKARQFATYELVQVCPSTLNGVTCP